MGEFSLMHQDWTITLVFSSNNFFIRMKTRSTAFLGITIMIPLTNRCSTKNSLLWQEILMMFLSVPQPLKLLANIFLSHRYIYLVTCRLQCTWTPHYNIKKEKQYHEKKLRSLSKKIVLASEYYYTCVIVLLFIFLRRFITWKLSPDRV